MDLINYIIPLAVSLIVGYSTYKTYQIYLLRKKFKHIPGPPTKGLLGFYLGNIPDLMHKMKKEKKFLMEVLFEEIKIYGPLIKIQIFDRFMVLTIDTQANRDILIDQDFDKYPIIYEQFGFPFDGRFVGRGLLTQTDFKKWKHRRALLNPGFHRQYLMSYVNEFNTKGDILLDKLRKYADGKTVVTMLKEINRTTLDIIASVAFGMEIDSVNDPNNKLNYYISEAFRGFTKLYYDPLINFKPNEWNFISEYRKMLKKLREFGKEQIMNRFKLIQEGSYVPNDILTIIIKSYEDKDFNIDDLIDEFITFFAGGTETSANSIAFCILELGRNPQVLKKAREELVEVLGSRDEVKYEDLAKLSYLGCIIKEALRKWPTVPATSRYTPKGYKIGGVEIPEKTWIMVSSYVCGRFEKYFPDPLEFRPERFMSENSDESKTNYTYFPFSLGPRNCIGLNFAQIEMKVLLSKFIKNFDFELDPNQRFYAEEHTTLRPADGTKCILTLRKE